MKRSARRPNVRPKAGDGLRHAVVVAVIGVILGFGLFGADKYVATRRQTAAAGGPSNGEVYTGSILYMPDAGKTCHQLLFDNHTGKFSDKGEVDCEHAAYRGSSATPKQWSDARAVIISNGFRGR